jgi:hypothetical protein
VDKTFFVHAHPISKLVFIFQKATEGKHTRTTNPTGQAQHEERLATHQEKDASAHGGSACEGHGI